MVHSRRDSHAPSGHEELFEEAMALVGELKYDKAAGRFAPLEDPFAASGRLERAAQCLFWEGYCNEKLGRLSRAAEMYRQVLDRYADTRAAATTRRRLAQLAAPAGP